MYYVAKIQSYVFLQDEKSTYCGNKSREMKHFLVKEGKESNWGITTTMEEIYLPECQRLATEHHNYPVTIMYMPLQFCGF